VVFIPFLCSGQTPGLPDILHVQSPPAFGVDVTTVRAYETVRALDTLKWQQHGRVLAPGVL